MNKSGYILSAAALLMVPACLRTNAQTTGVSNPDAAPAQTTPPPAQHYREIGVFAPVVRPKLPVTPAPDTSVAATPSPAPKPTAAPAPVVAKEATPAPTPAPVAKAIEPAPAPAPVVAKEVAPESTPGPEPVVAKEVAPEPAPTPAPAPALIPRDTPAPAKTEEAQVTPHTPLRPITHDATDKSLIITDDVNSGIVSEVHAAPNELPEGTLIRVRLDQEISTNITERGAKFQAVLNAPVERNGQILIPAGATLNGRVTGLKSGRHIGHNAAIHLQPDFIKLADGTTCKLDAQVIDLFMVDHHTHVSSEGTILGNDNTPGTIAALGATTGAAAATGAVFGGAVGAFVGAGIGAGASTMIWLRQESTQTLAPGTIIVFSLNHPMFLDGSAR